MHKNFGKTVEPLLPIIMKCQSMTCHSSTDNLNTMGVHYSRHSIRLAVHAALCSTVWSYLKRKGMSRACPPHTDHVHNSLSSSVFTCSS